MRSVNTLDWHRGRSLSLKAVSLRSIPFDRIMRRCLQILFYIPNQLNRYLNSLDYVEKAYCNTSNYHHNESMQRNKYRHVPARVWQRRSALIVMLEEEQMEQKK